jgi:hypothetical protein
VPSKNKRTTVIGSVEDPGSGISFFRISYGISDLVTQIYPMSLVNVLSIDTNHFSAIPKLE